MGCFVRGGGGGGGGQNGMGCYVLGDKTAWDVVSGATKAAWDVLSGVATVCVMFCLGSRKWHGMFCPRMFCPAPFFFKSVTY